MTAFRARGWAGLIAFSPDGLRLAAAADERGTEIRDVATGHLVKRIQSADFARSVTFSPDGRQLFIGQYDGRGRLYSTHTFKPVGRVFEGHTDRITFAQFSRDGRMLVTSGADGKIFLWDATTQKPIGSPLALAALRLGRARGHARARDRDHGSRDQLRHVAGSLETARLRRRRA